MTAFFATRKIDISSLKSEIDPNTNNMSASISIALTQRINIEDIERDFLQLCEQFGVQGCINETTHSLN